VAQRPSAKASHRNLRFAREANDRYLATDKLIAAKFSSKAPSVTSEMCGMPNPI
jgi:hypothetical protein